MVLSVTLEHNKKKGNKCSKEKKEIGKQKDASTPTV